MILLYFIYARNAVRENRIVIIYVDQFKFELKSEILSKKLEMIFKLILMVLAFAMNLATESVNGLSNFHHLHIFNFD